MPNDTRPPKSKEDLPGFWFAKLERADETGDWETAAEAKRNLRRLGWDVSRVKSEVGA